MNNATTWILKVFDSRLTANEKLVCSVLRTFMNDRNTVVWPSVATICRMSSLSERSVQRCLQSLKTHKFLVDQGKSGNGTNCWTIGFPDSPPVTVAPPRQSDTPVTVTPELTKNIYKGKSNKKFVKPTLEEVAAYCAERESAGKSPVDPQAWMDHYESNGWKVGRNPMQNWKAAVRTWERSTYQPLANKNKGSAQEADLLL